MTGDETDETDEATSQTPENMEMTFRAIFFVQSAVFLLSVVMYLHSMGTDTEAGMMIFMLVIGFMTLPSFIFWRRKVVLLKESRGQTSVEE